MASKTQCPVSRPFFDAFAKPITLTVADHEGKLLGVITAMPKEFSTHSIGWGDNGKLTVPVAGDRVTVQVGLNLTVVGSKDLPVMAPAELQAASRKLREPAVPTVAPSPAVAPQAPPTVPAEPAKGGKGR